MKPFNLEAALSGAKVVTRDGREVTEIYLFKTKEGSYPLIAVIDGEARFFTEEGNFDRFNRDSEHDLFMAGTKREGWVNIYGNSRSSSHLIAESSHVFLKKESADVYACKDRIACAKIEWEE